jgi:hypothetical protein
MNQSPEKEGLSNRELTAQEESVSLEQTGLEGLRPVEHERKSLQDLVEWGERSMKAQWVWGEPLGNQP